MTSRGPFQPKTFYDSMILEFVTLLKLRDVYINSKAIKAVLQISCSVYKNAFYLKLLITMRTVNIPELF